MLTLEMLPAGCGDCLWLEYGASNATRIVIVDGGVRSTASALLRRLHRACHERSTSILEVELLVVTHIDNDHILGIIEFLRASLSTIKVKDIWFNGRKQLRILSQLPTAVEQANRNRLESSSNLLGTKEALEGDDVEDGGAGASVLNSHLLGVSEGDALSELLTELELPCNTHACWQGGPVMITDDEELPVVMLDGGIKLTILGPSLMRLRKLSTLWKHVSSGEDSTAEIDSGSCSNLLGRFETWPPVWSEKEDRDTSVANGSSIMMLVEYGGHALLLSGDGFASDLSNAIERVRRERKLSSRFPLAAFKLPHHASERNVSRRLLEQVECVRYLISTDGSQHGHPDHQSILRILKYSEVQPSFCFNYETQKTRPWRESKRDVLRAGFQNYRVQFPDDLGSGLTLQFN